MLANLAIKFGRVKLEEAYNQHAAATLVNPDIVVVPRVYDYFRCGDRGFLVMEFVPGRHPTPLEYAQVVPEVAKCLAHQHTFTRRDPGPYMFGRSLGILGCDEPNQMSFGSKEILCSYLNSRLCDSSYRFEFGDAAMAFCHLDAAPRNIIVANNKICLLHWESAGFYPRSFEYCAARLNCGREGRDGTYCKQLGEAIREVEALSNAELVLGHMVERVVGNNIRYDLRVLFQRHNMSFS